MLKLKGHNELEGTDPPRGPARLSGRLIVTDALDRVISFDRSSGILRAEAGLSIDRLLRVIVPQGWFVPVTPGTKFVTLGGAVANDVHGKNHEHVGTFGSHVTATGLARSSGKVLTLSPDENAELFAATIGGLGLTGVILWVELELAPIRSAMFDTETFALNDLADFFKRAQESGDWPYTVAARDLGRVDPGRSHDLTEALGQRQRDEERRREGEQPWGVTDSNRFGAHDNA
jgi:FAD/FMN-containing dehydrogenase